MEIVIKPQIIKSQDFWKNKKESVIFVEDESQIEPLFELLCKQDSYWKDYKHLIKVSPKEINNERELKKYCEHCGKTDIYNIKEIKEQIPFFIYQYEDTEY